MKRHLKTFHLIRQVLYRKLHDNGQEINQLVLPAIYKQQVLKGLHSNVGHTGKDRTAFLIRERFYWPGYMNDIDKFVQYCGRCLRRKSHATKAPMVNIKSTYPLERVCMDFLTADPCKGNIENILVITDHFTKFSVAVPTKNQTAKTTAEALVNHFFLQYGIPSKLHSDQGKNFESDLIKELCKLMDIQKTRTTIYHPMCNGQTERYNRTLLDMLGTLEPTKKSDWKKYLPTLVYSYNATKHESTGYTPFELMFGRKPKLPIDSMFQVDNQDNYISSDYVSELKERLQTSHNIANKALEKARSKQKHQFDKKAKATRIDIGDTVLVKILAYQGKHKIADKFEQETYKVVDQPNKDIPVYIVKTSSGNERTLHRNHLLPIEVRDEVETEKEAEAKAINDKRPVPRPRRKVTKTAANKPKDLSDLENIEEDIKDDSESEIEYVVTYSADTDRPAGRDGDLDGSKTEDEDEKVSGTDRETEEIREDESVIKVPGTETRSAHADVEETVVIGDDTKDDSEIAEEDDETTEEEIQETPVMDVAEVRPAAAPPPPPPPRRSTRTRRKPDLYVSQQVAETKFNKMEQIKQLVKEQALLNAKLLSSMLD